MQNANAFLCTHNERSLTDRGLIYNQRLEVNALKAPAARPSTTTTATTATTAAHINILS